MQVTLHYAEKHLKEMWLWDKDRTLSGCTKTAVLPLRIWQAHTNSIIEIRR
jgi:hypothetical protein